MKDVLFLDKLRLLWYRCPLFLSIISISFCGNEFSTNLLNNTNIWKCIQCVTHLWTEYELFLKYGTTTTSQIHLWWKALSPKCKADITSGKHILRKTSLIFVWYVYRILFILCIDHDIKFGGTEAAQRSGIDNLMLIKHS